jgi:hypothetical protein
MSTLCLSIAVYGPGTDANNRSHWAFAIHKPGSDRGNLLQVLVISLRGLIYQLDARQDVTFLGEDSEGAFALATLTAEQAREAARIIAQEPAPRDGVDRCQDWTLSAVIALEEAGLVADGASDLVARLIGNSAAQLAAAVGTKWISSNSRRHH